MMKNKKDKVDYENLNEVLGLSKKILKTTFILMILGAVLLGLYLLRETKIFGFILTIIKVISPLFIGLLIAWLLDPLVKWFEKKGVKRVIASVFAFFVFLLVLYLLIILIFPALATQVNDFVGIIPSLVTEISDFLNNLFAKLGSSGVNFSAVKEQVFAGIQQMAAGITTGLPNFVVNFATSFVSGLGVFLLGIIVGFYLLVDLKRLGNFLEFVPKKYHKYVVEIGGRLNNTCRNFIQGTLLISGCVFLISLIGFSVIGLKAPMLFALICAITNVIPYLGPWIGGAIAAIVGFTISPITGILTIVVAFVVQQLDSIILQPVIMGKTMKLHPVTIMVGLLVFGEFFGILGMILATPIIAAFKTILNYFDEKYDLMSKLKSSPKEEEEV